MRQIFLLAFFSIFFILSSFSWVHAQTATESASPSATTVSPSVSYELAYPGLLPDQPLYFFKVIRDKVVSFLINDPIKRAEFNLLTSDKRFNAGVYIAEKKKYEVAIDTISKSTNYLHDSIVALEKAKSMNRDVSALRDEERVAIDKRLEIAKGLQAEFPEANQDGLQKEVSRIKKLKIRLDAL